MRLLPNDILLRKTPNGVTVWLSHRAVLECCDISEGYLRKVRSLYKRSLPASWLKGVAGGEFFLGESGKSWRWGKRSGGYYYDIDSIPNKKPCCYRKNLPSKEDILAEVRRRETVDSESRGLKLRELLRSEVISFVSQMDSDFFNVENGIKRGVCDQYAEALGWCRMVSTFVGSKRYKDFGFKTQASFYQTVSDMLTELRLPNLRVSKAKSLRQKIEQFPEELNGQRSWILSGKIGNRNRLIVGKYPIVDHSTGEITSFDVHQAVMYSLYMNIGGVEKERLLALYSDYYVRAMYDFGIEPIAYRTFCHQLTRLGSRLKMDYWKHGEDYYRKKMLAYTPSEGLTYAHSLFCGDGSGTIGYGYYDKSAGGKLKIMNLYTMVISDVASGYITGYSFSDEGQHKESADMVSQAVKMSVKEGGFQTMFEFVSDNHGAFTSAESRTFLKSVFDRVRTISVGNSQANPAETQFRLFKNTMLRSMRNFIRTSHGASIDNTANLENINKEDYPSYDRCIDQFEERVRAWNNRKGKDGLSPAEKFAKKHPECVEMSDVKKRLIFGEQTKVSVERQRGFIIPRGSVAKSYGDIMFEIPNYASSGIEAIQKATGNRYDSEVRVVFDQKGADLYSLDGKYIMTCPVSVKAKNASIEKTDTQRDAQVHHANRKKEQIKVVHDMGRDVVNACDNIEAFLGYQAEVRLNGGKERVNELNEAQINEVLENKPKKNRTKNISTTPLTDDEVRRRAVEHFY